MSVCVQGKGFPGESERCTGWEARNSMMPPGTCKFMEACNLSEGLILIP